MPKLISTEQFIDKCRSRHGDEYDYSKVIYQHGDSKIDVTCSKHGTFQQRARDHLKGSGCQECAQNRRQQTNLERYGVTNPFMDSSMIKRRMVELHGVENISQLQTTKDKKRQTCLSNFGVENPNQSQQVRIKAERTNLRRYGFKSPMQNKEISSKMMKTKVENGSFSKSNSSIECSNFCREYIISKGYSKTQVAFSDPDQGLFEWGYNFKGVWLLFDLVIFEDGHRGSIDHIIEVVEWQGPFHYTKDQVELRGDQPAYPWRTNKTTIAESFARDELKREFIQLLGKPLIEHWEAKYHAKK